MYIAQRQGKITPRGQQFDCNKNLYYFNSTFVSLSVQSNSCWAQKCVQRIQMPPPEKLKRKLLTPDADGHERRRTGWWGRGHLNDYSTFSTYKCIGTQIWRRKKVKDHSSVIIWTTLHRPESQCYVRFSLPQVFLALEKMILKCFFHHIWTWRQSCLMVELFEQFVSILPNEGPMWNLVKLGQAVSENKTFKDYRILYLYISHGQGQITHGEQNLDCN